MVFQSGCPSGKVQEDENYRFRQMLTDAREADVTYIYILVGLGDVGTLYGRMWPIHSRST